MSSGSSDLPGQMKNSTEGQIQKIAHQLYERRTEQSLPGTPEEDWTKAETIFQNKPRYLLWSAQIRWQHFWQFLHEHHYPLIVLLAFASLLANMWMMTRNIQTSKTSIDLDTRPYLSINMEQPVHRRVGLDAMYGNDITLKNSGKTPATQIATQYYITTELDRDNMNGTQWYDQFLGGFGGVSFLASQATGSEYGFRSLSPSAEYYYWEALVTYEGLEVNKTYWTRVKKVYFIDRTTNRLLPVLNSGEWDRNQDFDVPRISTSKEIVALLEQIKKKRKAS